MALVKGVERIQGIIVKKEIRLESMKLKIYVA